MKTYTVNGTYGSSNLPCIVFVYETNNGMRYYVAERGIVVNITPDPIEEGTHIEDLYDVDCFTWSSPILSLEDLELAVEN